MVDKMLVRLVAAVLLGLALWFGYAKVKSHFAEFADLKEYKESAKAIGTGTEAGISGVETAQDEIQKFEFHVTTERARAERSYEELKNENQDVADWSNGRIPLLVRQREAERKSALNRLADSAGGSEAAGTATPSGGVDHGSGASGDQ